MYLAEKKYKYTKGKTAYTLQRADKVTTQYNSQVAVLFSVDSKMVMFLSKAVPDMLTHTETKPSASIATKGSANPTNSPV